MKRGFLSKVFLAFLAGLLLLPLITEAIVQIDQSAKLIFHNIRWHVSALSLLLLLAALWKLELSGFQYIVLLTSAIINLGFWQTSYAYIASQDFPYMVVYTCMYTSGYAWWTDHNTVTCCISATRLSVWLSLSIDNHEIKLNKFLVSHGMIEDCFMSGCKKYVHYLSSSTSQTQTLDRQSEIMDAASFRKVYSQNGNVMLKLYSTEKKLLQKDRSSNRLCIIPYNEKFEFKQRDAVYIDYETGVGLIWAMCLPRTIARSPATTTTLRTT